MKQHGIVIIFDHDEAEPLPSGLQSNMIAHLDKLIMGDTYMRRIINEHDITLQFIPSTRNPLRKNTQGK